MHVGLPIKDHVKNDIQRFIINGKFILQKVNAVQTLKKTRSISEPLIISLYCAWNNFRRSDNCS